MTFTSVTDDFQSSRYLENVPQDHTSWGPTLKLHDRQMWVELSMCHQMRGARRCIKRVAQFRQLQTRHWQHMKNTVATVWITVSAELHPSTMSAHSSILLLITLWASVQDGKCYIFFFNGVFMAYFFGRQQPTLKYLHWH